MVTNRIPIIEIEKQGNKQYLCFRFRLVSPTDRQKKLQQLTLKAILILSVMIVLMSAVVLGLTLMLVFPSRPEAGQILLALLRFLFAL